LLAPYIDSPPAALACPAARPAIRQAPSRGLLC